MANHKSAIKRHKQSLKRRENNRLARATYRTEIKKTLASSQVGNTESAEGSFNRAMKLLDKAVVHGVLHKNTARRYISRLRKTVNAAAQA